MSNSIAPLTEADTEDDSAALELSPASPDDYTGLLTTQRIAVGDLVAFVSSKTFSFLVKVAQPSAKSIFLGPSGSFVWEVDDRHAKYRIPGWASTASLKALEPYTMNLALFATGVTREGQGAATKSPPRAVSGPLIARMNSLSREVAKVYQEHAEVLDNFHERLSHKRDLRFGSLRSISAALLRLPPDAVGDVAQLATLRALARGDEHVAMHANTVRTSGFIQIKSVAETTANSAVADEIRAWLKVRVQGSTLSGHEAVKYRKMNAGPIDRFLEKAVEIIKRSRASRPLVHGSLGMSAKQQQPVAVHEQTTFNSGDQRIITFLKEWACESTTGNSHTSRSLAAILLEATGMYDDDTADGLKSNMLGYLFLQEIGVVLPYHLRASEDRHLLLPGTSHSHALNELMQRTDEPQKLSDSMQHLRHDWRRLRVFCIDSASTGDVDDGISVTPGPDHKRNGDTWVHVHIANPTAYLSLDSAITTRARHMGQTIYTPTCRISMLPGWAITKYWSLAPGRACLTLSMLVDGTDGHIITTEVKPGFVRNVVRMTPEEVSKHLDPTYGVPVPGGFQLGLAIDSETSKPEEAVEISAGAVQELKMLSRVAELRVNFRLHKGADPDTGNFRGRARVSVAGIAKQESVHGGFRATTSRETRGDPVINLRFSMPEAWDSPKDESSPGDKLVLESMLLACEGAGRWAEARDVPLIYRGVAGQPAEAREQFWREVCEPTVKKHGALPDFLRARYRQMWSTGGATLGTRPLKHSPLGLDGYAQVSSPLRRFADLLNHWQIQAALLKESSQAAMTTTGLDAPGSVKIEPYSDEALQGLANSMAPRETQIRRYMQDATGWWATMGFFRAFYYKEVSLPEVFTGQITHDRRFPAAANTSIAQLFSYGVGCTFEHADLDIAVGDICEFAIERVDTREARIEAKWLRLIKRFETVPPECGKCMH